MEELTQLLIDIVSKYPVLASIVGVIGILRLIFKPLFSFLRSVADSTPTVKDNELLDKVEKSKAYSFMAFLIDYLGSIKLPEKK